MAKSKIYAATKAAREKVAKGEYKRKCLKGCVCGIKKPQTEPDPKK